MITGTDPRDVIARALPLCDWGDEERHRVADHILDILQARGYVVTARGQCDLPAITEEYAA